MPIENTGPIRLRGAAGDGRTDINEEINGNVTDTDVSLGTLNTARYATVAEGNTPSGRSMSEMRGYAAFDSAFPSTEADGALGESLLFDGNNSQYASFTPSIAGNRRTWTMSFWVKINKNGTQETIISQGSTSVNNVFVIRRESTNKFAIYTERSGGYSKAIANSLIIDNSGWYNVVVAFDVTKTYSGDKVRIYINGIEEKDITYSNSGGLFNDTDWAFNVASSAIRIGQYRYTNSDYLDGVIADFKFIDGQQLRPDSFGELVQGIWIPKAFNTASTDTLVTSNLIANYQLNGNANDTSGSATTYNGTPSNVTFLNNNYGILEIEGSSDKVDFSTIPSSVFNNATVSVSTWVNMKALASTSLAGSHVFIGKGNWQIQVNSSSSYGFTFTKYHTSSGGNNGNNYASYYPEGGPKLNRWYHLVAVDDTPNGNGIKLYLDGELVAEASAYTNIDDNGWVAGIANYPGRTGGNYRVGETQIYTKALSASEVLQNYNATKHKYTYGLNGFWLPLNNTSTGSIDSSSNLKLHLDASDSSSYGGSGTTWSDLTSNNNDGTISVANYLSSTNGGVFDFDGSNDKIDFGQASNIIPASSDFSAEIWVNAKSLPNNYFAVIGQTTSVTPYGGFMIYHNHPNNTWGAAINKSGAWVSLGSSKSAVIGEWVHLTQTYDGNKLRLYANGVLVLDSTQVGALAYGSNNSLTIGLNDNVYAPVKVAQARVYTKALTAQEVITNYRATQGNYEQVSTVDISGNANSFTATNIDATDHIKDEPLDNYATLNPQDSYGTVNLSNGNLTITGTNSNGYVASTIGISSGKFYCEHKLQYTPDIAGNHALIVPISVTSADV